jgi:hypothetical protein
LRALLPAGDGARGVKICYWLLALGCWLSAALGQDAVKNKPHNSTAPAPKAQTCGPVVGSTLKCPRFGFTYKIPFGWVDRTSDMQNEGAEVASDAAKAAPAASAKSETLMAIFERPPGAPGETINSAAIIAAEPIANYPGVKQASDYFGPITELAEQRGFKIENEPYAFRVGAKQLVRGDFSKERGKLTMWQGSLVMIEKGYIVSFTFVGGSADEADELIANLGFATKARPHK